jgi:hypothetical protein
MSTNTTTDKRTLHLSEQELNIIFCALVTLWHQPEGLLTAEGKENVRRLKFVIAQASI